MFAISVHRSAAVAEAQNVHVRMYRQSDASGEAEIAEKISGEAESTEENDLVSLFNEWAELPPAEDGDSNDYAETTSTEPSSMENENIGASEMKVAEVETPVDIDVDNPEIIMSEKSSYESERNASETGFESAASTSFATSRSRHLEVAVAIVVLSRFIPFSFSPVLFSQL